MIKLHKSTVLTLPFPPSMNHYWRHFRGMVVISTEGKNYRRTVQAMVGLNPRTLDGRLALTVWAWMPDRRKRDLDNLLKCLLDSCTKAGVWHDDNQIRKLTIADRGVQSPGRVMLRIREIDRQKFFPLEG
jgi:crossover junction endodeoxyribonuclease RusA